MTRLLLFVFFIFNTSCLREKYYDSAKGPVVDSKKWEIIRNFHQPTIVDKLSSGNGHLDFELRSKGDQKIFGGGVNHLRLRATSAERNVNYASTTIQVHKAKNVNCNQSTALPLFSRVALGKFIFKVGQSSQSKIEGDILVVTGIYQDPLVYGGDPRAFALVLKCGDPCYVLNDYIPKDAPKSEILFKQDLGAVKLETPTNLGFQWRSKDKQIIFYRMNDLVATFQYTFESNRPPHVTEPQIDIGHFVPNCEGQPSELYTSASFSDLIFEHRR